MDRQCIVDPMVHLVDSTEEWKERKRKTGEMCRRCTLNPFPTQTLISPYPEAAGIDDKEDAEAKDEGSSAAPHHCHHQVPTGHQLSTCGVQVLGCVHPQHHLHGEGM